MKQDTNTPRPIMDIAHDISADWQDPYFGAKPYITAMYNLWSIDDLFGMDDARSILTYFLANAGTWRGQKAREIKAEIKEMLK